MSLYSKIIDIQKLQAAWRNVKKNKPISGLVQTLRITEKQFSRMEYIVGEKTNEVLDSDERIVIL